MKQLLLSVLILASVTGHAATIPLNTDIPGSVLFNFQIQSPDQPLVGSNIPYESVTDPTLTIINAIASFNFGGNSATPWLDATNSGGSAGLGVCKTTNCAGSSDDNLSVGESITLTISDPILVGDIYFKNGVHTNTFADDAAFNIQIDGGTVETILFSSLSSVAGFLVFSDFFSQTILNTVTFSFSGNNAGKKYDYYVSGFGAPVPIPAALPMLLAGLLVLGSLGRRKLTT